MLFPVCLLYESESLLSLNPCLCPLLSKTRYFLCMCVCMSLTKEFPWIYWQHRKHPRGRYDIYFAKVFERLLHETRLPDLNWPQMTQMTNKQMISSNMWTLLPESKVDTHFISFLSTYLLFTEFITIAHIHTYVWKFKVSEKYLIDSLETVHRSSAYFLFVHHFSFDHCVHSSYNFSEISIQCGNCLNKL